MHQTVRAAFRAFSTMFEGAVSFMYLDIKGLVTCGVGNLIDPIELALDLPWRWRSKGGAARPGELASQAEIRREWDGLKARTDLAHLGHRAAEKVAMLELDEGAIMALIVYRLDSNEAILKRHPAFAALEDWPADAQLGLLSMAWAMGPGFGRGWPRFSAACMREDFTAAADACRMADAANPGLVPRNVANRILFRNAGVVARAGRDRAPLSYPAALAPE